MIYIICFPDVCQQLKRHQVLILPLKGLVMSPKRNTITNTLFYSRFKLIIRIQTIPNISECPQIPIPA